MLIYLGGLQLALLKQSITHTHTNNHTPAHLLNYLAAEGLREYLRLPGALKRKRSSRRERKREERWMERVSTNLLQLSGAEWSKGEMISGRRNGKTVSLSAAGKGGGARRGREVACSGLLHCSMTGFIILTNMNHGRPAECHTANDSSAVLSIQKSLSVPDGPGF